MPPTSELRAREIRLKSDALKQLADAAVKAGDEVRSGHHGRPSPPSVLKLRNRTGTDSNLFALGRQPTLPSNQSLAWIAHVHAQRLGIPWWEALGRLCENVDLTEVESDTTPSRAAA